MLLRPEPYRIDNRLVGARFDFTRATRPLSSLITFSRASSATYFDSAGVLQTAGSGVARAHAFQDHDPVTLEPMGFLIEEQRTNSIRNNTMVGASAPSTAPTNWALTTVAGIAASVVVATTEDGIACLEARWVGTAGASGNLNAYFETATGVAALTAQTWTLASYLRRTAGSNAGINSFNYVMDENTSGGAFVTAGSLALTAPSTAALRTQRQSFTRTLSGGGTVAAVRPYLNMPVTIGAVVDITLRIGLPQLELGAFATSPILTTGSAATRLADSASITGAAFTSIWNAASGTILAVFDRITNTAGGRVVTVSDGTANEQIRINASVAAAIRPDWQITDGGVSQANVLGATTVAINTQIKTAGVYEANYFQQSTNAALGTEDTSGAVPTVDRLALGANEAGTASLNGHIQSLTYYRKRLSNELIQELTAA